ncbi:MMPL family transporter [Rothia sp. P7181]|uniref:MMPL family transporter n=1 Tax=Rothia sp. P7181 TaxID=3402663 RepID=UPI003AE888F4
MESILRWLGITCFRHSKLVVIVWALILGVAGIFAATFSQGAQSNYAIPGATFEKVNEKLHHAIPEAGTSSASIVFSRRDGKPIDYQERQKIRQLSLEIADLPEVASISNPFEQQERLDDGAELLAQGTQQLTHAKEELAQGQQALAGALSQLPDSSPEWVTQNAPELAQQQQQLEQSRDRIKTEEQKLAEAQRELNLANGERVLSKEGNIALITLTFTEDVQALSSEQRQKIFDIFNTLENYGIDVDYSNELAQDVSGVFGASETIGLIVAAIVLLATLASVIAAGLPVLIALVGCGVGVLLVFASTLIIPMTSTDPVLALMLGLGVGIDYALLIIHRHREFLAEGNTLIISAVKANMTAGHSVVFAGATNIVALSALSLTGIPFLSIMGLAGAFTVGVTVLVAITLTPALLALVGMRILSTQQQKTLGQGQPQHTKEEKLVKAERGWGAFVTRHPVMMTVLSLTLLGLAIIPMGTLRLGLPDGSYQSQDSTAYRSYEKIADTFGPGANGRIYAVATTPVGTDAAGAHAIGVDVAEHLKISGIRSAAVSAISKDSSVVVVALTPETGPADEQTVSTVHQLHKDLPQVENLTRTQIGLSGQTVANIEISDRISQAVPLYLTVVLLLCLLIMTVVFKSLLIPLMATVGFLMSTLAAFGAVVLVYQWGWLGTLFGVTHAGPILAFLPILLVGVLFGLSVDYQIFIVSGMRDAYREGFTAREAVKVGYTQGGKVVTACGVIMISVFAGFVFSHLTVVRPIGFALAIGVAMDAFLVRTTFIPATMHLLGEKAWWLPASLKKVLGTAEVTSQSFENLDEYVRENKPRHLKS